MKSKHPTLERALGLFDATMLVVGCIVGVGIFRTASSIAGHVQSPGLILLLWLAGGLLSLCGALCYAELAGMFPASGGDYVYITKVYGRFWGFLFGWTKLFIERTGTIAILAFVFAEYFRRVLLYDDATLRWVASGAVVLLTAVNVVGVRWGKYVQNVFTVLKIGALVALIAAGFHAFTTGRAIDVAWMSGSATLPSLAVALVFVLWTYGGWTEAAYVAEEVKDPTRNVPRAILQGLLLTTVLYMLVNWSYLLVIPIGEMPTTPLVASRVMEHALGSAGALFIAWMIACSAFGALNGYILTGARILYAIGQDHALFKRLGTLDPSLHTPAPALWANAAVAILLIFTKTFDQIMTYSTLVIQIFFSMAVLAVIILRRTHPKQPRPYRAWGYPWTAVIYLLVMAGFVVNVCLEQRTEAVFGFLFLAAGLPLYWISQWVVKDR